MNSNIFKKLLQLWGHLSSRRKLQSFVLCFLVIFASIAELISIGSLIPFVGMLTMPEKVFQHPLVTPFVNYFNIASAQEILMPVTILFCSAIILAAMVRVVHIWFSTRLAYAIGSDISCKVFRNSLAQPYAKFLETNSSELLNSVATKLNIVIQNILYPCFSLFAATVMLAIILSAIFFAQPYISLILISSFGSFYFLIIFFIRKGLLRNSKYVVSESTKQTQIMQESVGGIRDIIIDNNQRFYLGLFAKSDMLYRRAQASTSIIGQSPRFIIEAAGIVGIAIFAVWHSSSADNVSYTVSLLGTLAYGAQRLMPILQLAFASYSSVQGGHAGLDDILGLLERDGSDIDTAEKSEITFQESINFCNSSFSYSGSNRSVFKNLDLTILKGSRVGVVGETGSGKSTFVDCLMGLLCLGGGSVKVDGVILTDSNIKSWRSKIAHVPQSVFLCDGSVSENIAFGVAKDQIDMDRVRKAANIAQISDFIENQPGNYDSIVGERGAQLSGGQVQRIGIARAFYKHAEVIIFDEATSALDQDTEDRVMDAIQKYDADCTIVIITHRERTLKFCSTILEFKKDNIFNEYSYWQYLNKGVNAS
jgi:ATP-binding cassette, subfamily B, bacterial PglK